MNSKKKAMKTEGILKDKVGEILTRIEAKIQRSKLPASYTNEAMAAIRSAAATKEEYVPLMATIRQRIREVKQWCAILEDMLTKVKTLETQHAQRERFSEKWWQRHRSALYETFKTDPGQGLRAWLRHYAKSLIAWELGICQKLVHEPFPFPTSQVELRNLFQAGTNALTEARYEDAFDMLGYLTREVPDGLQEHLLNAESRALLEILVGRICLYKSGAPEKAQVHFNRARDLVPAAVWPYAALAGYYLAENDPDEASSMAQYAIELSAALPDGYVSLGLWAESQDRWDEANELYDQAITRVSKEKDPYVSLIRLLTPVSGNLCLRLAQHLISEDDLAGALPVIDKALSLGIKGEGKYPEMSGYELKRKVLEALERPREEIAEAYYELGRRRYWNNEFQAAVDLFAKARGLNPDHLPTYWYWSDALRMMSQRSSYPYVDKEVIEESREKWDSSTNVGFPDADYSWAYITRALICEQMFNLPGSDQWALAWEAITYLERAILLREWDAYRWAYLGRFHRNLQNDSCALQATSKAIDREPANLAALEERVIILANAGSFNEATEALVRYEKYKPTIWIEGVRAYILCHKGQYQAALDKSHDVIEKAPEYSWCREIRILCCRVLDMPALAAHECSHILDNYDTNDITKLSSFGFAAYHLALIDHGRSDMLNQAINDFEKLIVDPTQAGHAYRSLGLCYLARGDLGLGEEYLEKGIALASNTLQLDELLKIDFVIIEKSYAKWKHRGQVREILKKIEEKIITKRTELEQPVSAEEELNEVIARLTREGKTDGWGWIGVHASLARLYMEGERWNKAAIAYKLLQKESARYPFPEAHIGLGNAIKELEEGGNRNLADGKAAEAVQSYREALVFEKELSRPEKLFGLQQRLGDALLKEGKPAEALKQFNQILAFRSAADDSRKQADLHARIGTAYFDCGELVKARSDFSQSIKLYRENDPADPGGALGAVCFSLLRNTKEYWTLDFEWKTFAEEPGTNESLRSDLLAGRRSLTRYLDDLYQLSAQFGKSQHMLPVVTPIAIEIGQDLIPEGPDTEWSLFKTYLPEMRARIGNEMGIQVPGVRIRGNEEDYLTGKYIIMVDEVPIVTGDIKANMRYCTASPDTLKELGIPEQGLIEVTNPLTGEPGCWVQPDVLNIAASKSMEVWEDPLLYMVYHLEAILRRNLADFLGIQAVDSLLWDWEQTERGSSLIKVVLPDKSARFRFARVLRALVKERVSIKSWEDILEAVQGPGLASDDVSEVVRAVRLQLNRYLPGNNRAAKHVKLPGEIEEKITPWIWRKNGKTFFAIPPEETQELLTAIRELVITRDKNLVLVTGSSKLRPFIRRLVELEFPDLMVISREELLSEDELLMVAKEGSERRSEGSDDDAKKSNP